MNDYIIESYEHNRLKIDIFNDTDAENPLEWESANERNGKVHFALVHKRYDLPYEVDADTADYNSFTELAEAVTAKGGELAGYNYRFIRWYEHSGVAVSLRDTESGGGDWDAGIAGVVFGLTTEDINRYFKPWQAYIQGDVYEYIVTNPKDGEVVASCSGFYDYDEAKNSANAEADDYEWPHDAAYAKNANLIHG